MKILLTLIVALGLHLTLGWAWTIVAGAVGGFWAGRRGWLVGAAGVALDWAVLVAYTFVVAAGPVQRMTATMGGLLGNLPGVVIVLLTVLIGAVVGALGGLVGALARRLFRVPAAASSR